MKQVFAVTNEFTYYIDRVFAWFPTYMQGELVWLRHYWTTWPEKDGEIVEMYRSNFPYDPRVK